MSTDQRSPITLPANADLSASLFCGVTYSSAGIVGLPAANAAIIGIIEVATTGGSFACGIRTVGGGKQKMRYGGTVAIADPLKVTSAGTFITASAGDVASGFQVGFAIKAGASGDIGEGILTDVGNAAAGASFDDIVLGTTAPSNLTSTTFVQTTGTKTGVLANGVAVGQTKQINQSVAASTPVGTITGTFLTLAGAAATTLALGTAVGAIASLVWTGAAWRATSAIGGTGSSLS